MNINDLIDEYDLTLNDIRWYLAGNLAFSLLEYKNDMEGLTRYIESGELEVELYNMEDKFIEETQDLIDRDKIDEVNIREILNKISLLKRKRFT